MGRAGGRTRAAVVAIALLSGACAAIIGIDDRQADDATLTPDGGEEASVTPLDAATDPVIDRTFTVTADWPTVADLDPRKDARATKITVDVTDAADPTRAAPSISVDVTNSGPYTVTFKSSSHVDAVVQVVSASGQILAYGHRRNFDVAAQPNVPVAVRKRLLYFCSGDRGALPGELRALGMAPPGVAEPAVDETVPELSTLKDPTDLYITKDGLTLVESGIVPANGKGALAVFATGSHQKVRDVELAFHPSGIARIGDGNRALAVPRHGNGDPAADVLAIVDVQSGQVTAVDTGLPGGAADITSVAASPDGTHVAAVGTIAAGGGDVPVLLLFDDATQKVTLVELAKLTQPLAGAAGVRYAPDGKSLIVVGSTPADGGWSTGHVVRLGTDGTFLESVFAMAADQTRPSGLVLHPDGKSAFVADEIHYLSASSCCGDTWLVDLAAKNATKIGPYGNTGPVYEFTAGFRVPYAPRYVWVGQTDNGNNVNGPLIDITTPTTPKQVPHQGVADIGSMNGVATPFGDPI